MSKPSVLYIPTKVYSESNCVRNHGKELASYGKKAMVVTGRTSSRENGSLEDVLAVLKEQNTDFILFDEIEENPSVETVMKARETGVKETVDFVIGIGGGSPLDASKAIALMIANPDKTEEVLYQSETLSHLPVVCVPTTCGTGSEATPYAILTLHKQRTKKSISHRIFPELALLDAKYLMTMGRSGLVNTAVDALAHLIESHLNTNSNEFNRMYTREGLRLWAKFKDNLKNDSLKEADYETMLHASTIAGMAISHTGTSLPHGLSYSVTYELDVPHGKAVGMFLGGFVAGYEGKEDVREVLELLKCNDVTEFCLYMRELLGIVEVSDTLMEKNAQSIFENPVKLKNYPFEITKEKLISMANH